MAEAQEEAAAVPVVGEEVAAEATQGAVLRVAVAAHPGVGGVAGANQGAAVVPRARVAPPWAAPKGPKAPRAPAAAQWERLGWSAKARAAAYP